MLSAINSTTLTSTKPLRYLSFLALLILASSLYAQPKVSNGRIQRLENFPSRYVPARHVDIWLPNGYDAAKQYAVVYFHDGQMLFDSSDTWTRQEWGVDETFGNLLQTGKIRDCIVVGIWNNGAARHLEYFPQKPFEALSQQDKSVLRTALIDAKRAQDTSFTPNSDRYLKFLTKELKPYIDRHYSTRKDAGHTFIAGSSMGGLISIYAVCEYPQVFGGAACLSTHWPGIFRTDNNPIPPVLLAYLDKHLPNPKNHRIYFDYGTETLDALYKPIQLKVDALMQQKGYAGNWMTQEFPGADHSEKAWKQRLHIPITFLLGEKRR